MKPFMDEDFLLTTPTAKMLYHQFAKPLPIVDYHCHISPEEIANDRKFETITQLWLGGDHYKWRQMRSNGIAEHYITGTASDREKFQKWAETLEKLIGNPLYHWSHLELKRYFGYDGILNGETAEEVWRLCNEQLRNRWSARTLILASQVSVICTTDDPLDDLNAHQTIAADPAFDVAVYPTWRPDRAMNLEKPEFSSYISKLSQITHTTINDFSSLKNALRIRMEYFARHGCRIADHGLEYVMFVPATEREVDAIFQKALHGGSVTKEEALKYKTAFLAFFGREYHSRNWVMQLHYGCKRDNHSYLYQKLGADTGFDCINDHTPSAQLADYLNLLSATNEVPRTILYSLNPADNAAIDTIIGCFQDDTAVGKLQHGSAWWFNDHKLGMTEQLSSLASLGCLGNFIGMLTDSRSFLSYTRHEYFRRILCDLIGGWVETGEYPNDTRALKGIVEGICYQNAMRYFRFSAS